MGRKEDTAEDGSRFRFNPLAGPMDVIQTVCKSARGVQKAVGPIGAALLLLTTLLKLQSRKSSAKLQIMVEKQKQKITAQHHLAKIREKVASPLLFAAKDLNERLRGILNPPSTEKRPTENWLLQNYTDKAEASLMATLYLFCRFIFWQRALTVTLEATSVRSRDEWNVAVNALNRDLVHRWASRKYPTFPAFPIDVKRSEVLDTSKYLAPSTILRKDIEFSQHRQQKFPFRLLPMELSSIAEIMRAAPGAQAGDAPPEHAGAGGASLSSTPRPWAFNDFATHLKAALLCRHHQRVGGEDALFEPDEKVDGWVEWILPLWDSLVRYNYLLRAAEHDQFLMLRGRYEPSGMGAVGRVYLTKTQSKLHEIVVMTSEISAMLVNMDEDGNVLQPLPEEGRLQMTPDGRLVTHQAARARRRWALLSANLAAVSGAAMRPSGDSDGASKRGACGAPGRTFSAPPR